MFSHRQRIPSADIRHVSRAIVLRSPYFFIGKRANGLKEARFGIVVGVKVDRRAVRRHLLRRKLSEMAVKAGFKGEDVVITLLAPANTLKAAEFRKVFEEAFKKLAA